VRAAFSGIPSPMDGRDLLRVFDCFYLLALAAWFGGLLFCVFGVAPLARRCLPAELADRIEGLAWTRCHLWGAVCGASALPALVCGALGVPELRGPDVGLKSGALLAALLLTLYAGNAVAPRLSAARDAGPSEAKRVTAFERRLSLLHNLILILVASLIVAHAYRGAPTTRGIPQSDPSQANAYQRSLYERNQQFWHDYATQKGVASRREAVGETARLPAAEGETLPESDSGESQAERAR
jgi:putative copper export protein